MPKIVIVGDAKTGKTTLVRAWTTLAPGPTPSSITYVYCDAALTCDVHVVPSHPVARVRAHCADASVIVGVWDATRPATRAALAERWLPWACAAAPRARIVACASKTDLVPVHSDVGYSSASAAECLSVLHEVLDALTLWHKYSVAPAIVACSI